MTKNKESSGCGSDAESLSKCWKEADLNGFRRRIASYRVPNRPRTFRVLLWSFVINLALLGHLWPSLRSCFLKDVAHSSASALTLTLTSSTGLTNQSLYVGSPSLPPRKYKNNGYLLVSSNGGLNQMRAGICDMVAIARLLNLTLIVPMLDKTSFWADSSDFGDIFDVDHFIASLRDEVRIIKAVPKKYYERVRQGTVLSIPPVSWSNESYYLNQILPLAWKHGILHFSKTDSRLANNGLPLYIQKLRCRTNYHSLRFTSSIEVMGRKLVKMLMENGPFAALHLRYEMDMLAFSGCTHGCTEAQAEELAQLRYANVWWKEKDINSEQRRVDGLCPLTPEETSVVLKALGFSKEMTIYIAAGEIYGGERRMDALHTSFSNVLQKDMVLSPEDLKPFQNHSSQMAALDYLVAINSHVFLPTYHGNMAKVVEGHRRYLGFRKTIVLDRMRLVELLDQHKNGTLEWDELALAIRKAHKNRMGARARRVFIPDRPKEEDSFYANPTECLT